jgi:phosphoribosylformimino-5-aminoimidazole carboxamide ribotide isomerase
VLIPSIDLMGGKIVQLVQGEKKALEFDDFSHWVTRFKRYPLVQLIDLDAAMGNGSNRQLIGDFCGQLPCQVGGGIRSAAAADEVLQQGAKRVIVSSALVQDGKINVPFASTLASQIGPEHLVCAIDSRGGRVAIHGWKTITVIRPEEMIEALEPYCAAFLYTHIDTEGLLQGIPMDVIRRLRSRSSRQFIAAGGIRSREEIDELDAAGVDTVVGMAIYSGLIAV